MGGVRLGCQVDRVSTRRDGLGAPGQGVCGDPTWGDVVIALLETLGQVPRSPA